MELLTEVSIDAKGRIMLPVEMRRELLKMGATKLSLRVKMDEKGIEIRAIPITTKTLSIRLVLRNEPGVLAGLFSTISDMGLRTVDATVETLGGGDSLKCFLIVASKEEVNSRNLLESLLNWKTVKEVQLISSD